VIDILEYVGREPDIILLYTHTGQSWKYNQHKKKRIEDIEEGIISMLWIGLKIK
jgi:hypothetical protein